MAEYIEIEQLWKCETCYHNGQHGCTLGLGCDHGENYRPAYSKLKKADVASVVHGRWIECDYVKYDGHSECIHYPKAAWKCSVCCNAFKKELLWKDNYCPNCGARMDGE